VVTDLEIVVDRQGLAGTAFIHDVLQHCRTRGVRDVVVQRKGEGEVGLCVGFDVDILLYSASDRVAADRIDKLYTTSSDQDPSEVRIVLTSNSTLLRATPK